jgi:prephenate dehydrogenase
MKASPFPDSVVLYGTGLMGCSFALALRKAFPKVRIYGVDDPDVLKRARQLNAVENDSELPASPDLIVLATPVGAILKRLDELPWNAQGLILDIGSTKVTICEKAERRKLSFIGGHPMTGSERSGPDAASADLFKDAPFFLCPISTTPEDAVGKLKPALEAIGARVIVQDAETHDRLVAQLSHLPQILSTVLADQTGGQKEFAGPGWKSATRLAASPFHVWRDILETSAFLPHELDVFITKLKGVLDALEAGKLEEIEVIFERANRAAAGETS